MSALLTLGQILLIQGKNAEYLDLCAGKLAGLIVNDAKKRQTPPPLGDIMEMIKTCSLAPLAASDFVKLLPRESVERQLPTWRKLAAEATPGASAQTLEFILYAALERLGKSAELATVRGHLERTNAALPIFGNSFAERNKGIDEFRKQLVQFLTGF